MHLRHEVDTDERFEWETSEFMLGNLMGLEEERYFVQQVISDPNGRGNKLIC